MDGAALERHRSGVGLRDHRGRATTDPGWVSPDDPRRRPDDTGGPTSHGAVIARELGIPCVIGSHTGNRDRRDGDLVRVNELTGTVDLLKCNQSARQPN